MEQENNRIKKRESFLIWFWIEGQTSANAGSPANKNYAPCTLIGAPRREGPAQSAERRPTLGGLPSWSQFLQCIVSMKERASTSRLLYVAALSEKAGKSHYCDHISQSKAWIRAIVLRTGARYKSSCLKLTKPNETDERSLAETLLTRWVLI